MVRDLRKSDPGALVSRVRVIPHYTRASIPWFLKLLQGEKMACGLDLVDAIWKPFSACFVILPLRRCAVCPYAPVVVTLAGELLPHVV